MKLVIVLIFLVSLIDICVSDKHTYGNPNEISGYLVHETILIDSNNTEPTSYFIKFQYFGSNLQTVTCIEFNVNSPSTGSIKSEAGSVKDPIYYNVVKNLYPTLNFFAEINVNATSNCKATLKIYEQSMFWSPIDFLNAKKSFTIIYAKNASPAPKRFGHHSVGKRENGDKLIHFQSRNVTNSSRFPSRSFEYTGEDYITYVGFSFNSPTAMVLLNSTFVSEKEFNAMVYDMNTEHFVANISVYGIKSRPENRIGVLGLL